MATSLTAAPGRAYDQLDARIAATNLFGRGLEFAVFAKNLSDDRDVLSNNIVSGEVTQRYTEPRTIGVELKLRFGS